jgi:hypothetical protein
MLQKK